MDLVHKGGGSGKVQHTHFLTLLLSTPFIFFMIYATIGTVKKTYSTIKGGLQVRLD